MPIRDPAAQDISLDNDYATMDVEVALFVGDPMTTGVELDGTGGYARGVLDSSGWDPAAGGMKSPTDPVQFPAPTDAWSDLPTHWQLFDHADSTTGWDCGQLSSPIEVTAAAAAGPLLTFSVYYADAVIEGP